MYAIRSYYDTVNRQTGGFCPGIVKGHPGQAAINYITNARDSDRGLGDVGGNHDLGGRIALKNPALICRLQAPEHGKYYGTRGFFFHQSTAGSDILFRRQEGENVTGWLAGIDGYNQ